MFKVFVFYVVFLLYTLCFSGLLLKSITFYVVYVLLKSINVYVTVTLQFVSPFKGISVGDMVESIMHLIGHFFNFQQHYIRITTCVPTIFGMTSLYFSNTTSIY